MWDGGSYGMSDGVTGSDGGGGRLMRVGALDMVVFWRGFAVRIPLDGVWACLDRRELFFLGGVAIEGRVRSLRDVAGNSETGMTGQLQLSAEWAVMCICGKAWAVVKLNRR